MLCPRDGLVLTLETLDGLDAYVCTRCRGVAFESHTLARLLEKPTSLEETLAAWQTVSAPQERSVQAHPYSEDHFVCPEGHGAMRRYRFGGNASFFVDACTECNVVWFDGWEVQALAAFMRPNLTQEALVRAFAQAEKQRVAEQREFANILETLSQVPTSPLMLVKLALLLAPILLRPLQADEEHKAEEVAR